MRWRRDTTRDLGRWFPFVACVPHLCHVCDSWFWFERGHCQRYFQCDMGSLWRFRCKTCWQMERLPPRDAFVDELLRTGRM